MLQIAWGNKVHTHSKYTILTITHNVTRKVLCLPTGLGQCVALQTPLVDCSSRLPLPGDPISLRVELHRGGVDLHYVGVELHHVVVELHHVGPIHPSRLASHQRWPSVAPCCVNPGHPARSASWSHCCLAVAS
jgi:hypothetical protein